MSITYSGYVRETLEDIITRIGSRFLELAPNINLDPSSIFYQWIKTVAEEEYFMQQLIEDAVANMTVLGANGVFLDYHAIEAGLFRKNGTYSQGYVQCEDIPVGYVIPEGSLFGTDNGIEYRVTENVTFNPSLKMTRGTALVDFMPSLYDSFDQAKAYYESTLSTEYSGYTVTGTEVRWTTGYAPAYGTNYYIGFSGTLRLNVPVSSTTIGVSGSTGPNTIVNNLSSLLIDAFNNDYAITGGTDQETDNDLRVRLLQAKRKTFTLEDIRDKVNQLEGVDECRVYQNVGTDRSILADWNDTADISGFVSLYGTGTYGFSFYPSGLVGTLQGITMYGFASGNAAPLYCYMTYHSSGQYVDWETSGDLIIAECTIDRGALASADESTAQDIFIPLKFNGIDRFSTYRVYLHPMEEGITGQNWALGIKGLTIPNYRLDHFNQNIPMGDSGFVYKTHYSTPSFTVSIKPAEGINFADIREDVEEMLDYVDGGGYGPICIQSIVKEATKKYLSIIANIRKEAGYTFVDVSDRIKTNISNYLDTLKPGDDIIYSQVEKSILNTAGVERVRGLSLLIDGGSWVSNLNEIDIPVGDDEYVVLDVGNEISGVTIAEG